MKFFKIVFFTTLAVIALILEGAHIIEIMKSGFTKSHVIGLIAGFITVTLMIQQLLIAIEGNE